MLIEHFRQRLRYHGAKPCHEEVVLRGWTHGLPLGSAEIVAQVALARARRSVRKVVFMGMGEPAHLVMLAERYAQATGYPIQYQWTLLEGINDGDDEVERIAALLTAVMNFIPYNAVEGLSFNRPSWKRAAAMARSLHRRGVLTKLRHSAGQDVDGGCGQLRARQPRSAVVSLHSTLPVD